MDECFGLDLKTKTESSLGNTKVLETDGGGLGTTARVVHIEGCFCAKSPMLRENQKQTLQRVNSQSAGARVLAIVESNMRMEIQIISKTYHTPRKGYISYL